MSDDIDSEAIYLYCFASSALLSTVDGMGVDGKNPVFLLPYRDVVAVAGLVSAEEFGGQSACGLLEIAWAGPRACRHEEVVERAMRHSPVLPVKLGTIFDSHESLENRLKKHHDAIRLFLESVSGKDEWGVKGLVNRALSCEQYFRDARAVKTRRIPPPPGVINSNGRRMRAAGKKALRQSLEKICKDLGEDLSRIAVDLRERQTFGCETPRCEDDLILDLAFLVPRDAASDFCALIRTANDECEVPGLVFDLSGPWPPYSFCPSLEEEGRP